MRRRVLLGAGAALALPGVARGQRAGVLRFVPQADVTVLDPIWTTATVTNTHTLLVFDMLYGLDAEYRPSPQMAAGHRIEDDGKTWLITLREGLRFHDGTPVLARDAVASIKRWGARDLFGQEVLLVADEIAAADDRTIRFRLKRPFPMLPAALGKVSPSVCAIMPERLAQTDPGKQVTEMVGSGPYRFLANERVVGARTVYARNDAYLPRGDGVFSRTAGPKVAHFERFEWLAIPDPATSAAALQAGEVDWLETTSSDLLPVFARNSRVVATYADDRNAHILRFNHLHPPFDNPAIRRALLGAIDQSDFMTAAFGDDKRGFRVGTGVFLSGTPMASDAGLAALTGTRDLDRVKRDLVAAGYKGERVVMLQPDDIASQKAMVEVAAALFRAVGMTVDVHTSDWGTVVQRRASREPVEKGGWNAFITGTSTTLDPSGHLGLRGNGARAWFGWPTSPKLEALRSEWFVAPDLVTQQALCRQMQVQAFEDVPYLPLGESLRLTAYRSDLSGFTTGAVNVYGVKRG